jgi:type II secretory pathway component PulF
VIEPVFIILMGIVVGFIVISMMQGIMAMSTSAG